MDRQRNPVNVEVGRRIARRRRLVGLMQRELAALTGLKPSHISQLERGNFASMKFRDLVTLARVLRTDVNYVVCFTDEDPGEIPPQRCPGTGDGHACGILSPVAVVP